MVLCFSPFVFLSVAQKILRVKTAYQKMVLCFCGRIAIVRTSWTSTNPGRRFHSCPQTYSRCDFIGWVDPLMCVRSTAIIPGLLRKMNKQDEVNHDLKVEVEKLLVEVRKLKMYLICSCVLIVAIAIGYV
ncbi:hypothetical protein LXL04_015238 [Taraxacum kok-saghyz]